MESSTSTASAREWGSLIGKRESKKEKFLYGGIFFRLVEGEPSRTGEEPTALGPWISLLVNTYYLPENLQEPSGKMQML